MPALLEERLRQARPAPPSPRPAVVAQARFLARTAHVERELHRPTLRERLAWPGWIPRRALVLCAAVVAALAAATMAGSSRDWWFLGTGAPKPISQPVVIVSRSVATHSWGRHAIAPGRSGGAYLAVSNNVPFEFFAYTANDSGKFLVCYGITPDPPNPKGVGAGGGCTEASFPGPGHSKDPLSETHWLTYMVLTPWGTETAKNVTFVYGPTAANVARVDLLSPSGPPISLETIPAPEGLGLDVRFYIAVLRSDQLVNALVPRDANGNALEHWNLPQAY
jgi:hypothetical protein